MNRPSATAFLFVMVFVDMLGYGPVVPLLPFYAGGLASGALFVGTLGSLYAAMQFFGGPFLAGLSDRTGRRPVLVVCLLGASLAYALLGLAETLTLVVVAIALAGAAGGTQATAQAFVADSTPPGYRARGLGLIGAAFGLGLMAGPLLGGLLSLHSLSAPALALANAAFDELGVPAPYFIGAALAALALPAVALSGRGEPVAPGTDPGVAVSGPRGFPTGRESERRT